MNFLVITMADGDYNWIPFYMEFADKLLEYKNNRTELINKIIRLWDNIDMNMPKLEKDNEIVDIDPFTIFGLFNKHLTDNNRISIINYFKSEFNVVSEIPSSFAGIPVVNPQKATFYRFKDLRGEKDIDNLWQLFETAIKYVNSKNEVNKEKFISAYNKVLNQKGIKRNISMALFWIRPYEFVNLDSRSRWFLSNPENVDFEFSNIISSLKNPPKAEKYLNICESCKNMLKENNYEFISIPELSYKAYVVSREDDLNEKEMTMGGIGDSDNVNEINYWLYAPGPGACFWDEYYEKGIMGMGSHDNLGNLLQYDSKEKIVKKLQEIKHSNSSFVNDSLAYWQFAHEIKEGDIVFAKKGNHEIVGYGIVKSGYFFDEKMGEYPHGLKVNWKEKGNWTYDGILVIKTLTKINDYTELINTINGFFESSPDDEEPMIEYPSYTKEKFLEEAYISEEDYDKLSDLLKYKKNIILQGAPGVGKTYISKRLAYSLLGCKDKSRVSLVQFHQSYSYEDFIMGYRPSADGFKLKNGVFYEFCKKARDDEQHDYYFIIDEINRGNLSKIFGELFMLIENDKRGSRNKIQLLYNEEMFYIPENVYIIGMMNTADRSLALIDYALRRRFAFYTLKPAFDSDNFIKYKNDLANLKFNKIINYIKELNMEISDDESLGSGFMIGHSYFTNLKQENINEKLDNIIEYEIIPLLEEYWFDEEEKVHHWKEILRSVNI